MRDLCAARPPHYLLEYHSELILNVCANLLHPECRRLRQNICYTSNTGTIDNEQIAQGTPFVVHL